MTKRKSYDNEYSDSKRPKFDDNRPDGHNPGSHFNPQQRNGGQKNTHNQNYGNHPKSQSGKKGAREPIPVFQDPMTSLQQLLKGITSNPQQAEKVLGADTIKLSSKLLSHIEKRDRTSTLSLDVFQPGDVTSTATVQAYHAGAHLRTVPLPPLPDVPDGPLARAPFIHKSMPGHNRAIAAGLNYESLEFLGDAYLEIMATRLIFSRFPHLAAGRQAQVREMLVKNETLLGYSQAYNFEAKLQVSGMDAGTDTDISRGNKALGKILADVFEAYVAAVILSDPEHGFERCESWMAELWAPVLLKHFGPESEVALLGEYDPNAKAVLQKRIAGAKIRLEYVDDRPPVQETKQNLRFFVALYLTGWGYEKKKLGIGEGVSKAEAGNRAAMMALVEEKTVVEDCERQFNELKAKRKADKDKERGEKVAEGGKESSKQEKK